jgi:hypothetical protein
MGHESELTQRTCLRVLGQDTVSTCAPLNFLAIRVREDLTTGSEFAFFVFSASSAWPGRGGTTVTFHYDPEVFPLLIGFPDAVVYPSNCVRTPIACVRA